MFDFRKLTQTLTGDVSKNKSFRIGTYAILGIVGIAMTILNVTTDKGVLTIFTAVFSGLCALCIGLTLIHPVTAQIAQIVFGIGILFMFTFFLVSGNPDGFSAIWICMLPSLGMFFFNRQRGSLLCITMFFILIFFLWVPYGQSFLQYEYTATFRMRFPILFVAFHMLAFLLETLRVNATKELIRLQDYYHELANRDPLTQIFNRQGLYSVVENDPKYTKAKSLTAIIFDLDHFKKINDIYGHDIGDVVLKEFAAMVEESLPAVSCRWGGEEFVTISPDSAVTPADLEELRRKVARHVFDDGERSFTITVSAGVATEEGLSVQAIDSLISRADDALYKIKSTPERNKIMYYEDITPKSID